MRLTALLLTSLFCLSTACTIGDDDGDDTSTPDAMVASDSDASTSTSDGGNDAALQFLDECEPANDTCDSTLGLICFSFNNKGPRCTHDCTVASDCESPSPGCNGMGVCKAP